MCGITGILEKDTALQCEELNFLVEELKHRGPDDSGTFIDDNFGFGMRRLSILDREFGTQPISNEDATKWIVFNGEIYNYLDLRSELIAKGHVFKTQSDTEAILHCYEEYGEECPNKLQGMFAFAIWDTIEKSLFISRDRVGIKPLFYQNTNQRFLFSSEFKGISSLSPCNLSLESLNHYFTFLYFPTTHTPLSEIKKLLPGHSLTVQDGNIKIQKYYRPVLKKEVHNLNYDKSKIDEFLTLARDVIKKHLLSEVPIGAFLSGGIDSSLIVALMSEELDEPVNTFAIGYAHGGEYFDERKYARQVANLFKTNHRELLVSPDDIKTRLPEIISKIGEPFGDASIIPNFLLSEYASKYVTVALSGLGGDEVCGGYERHLGVLIAEKMPLAMAILGNPIVKTVINNLPDTKSGSQKIERLKKFSQYAELKDAKEIYFSFISKFNEKEKALLFNSEILSKLESNSSSRLFNNLWNDIRDQTTLGKILQTDIETYLCDDILALSDRTSMANSLEMRVPFVDHTLLEFFRNLPDDIKIKGHQKKYLLKKVAERFLPSEIIYRKKSGFSIPIGVWFRNELKDFLYENIFSQRMIELDIFNHRYIETLIREHNENVRNHDEKLFSILSIALWLETRLFKNQ